MRTQRPSPAMAIACLALFVSLSGTAIAAGAVPLAKRALSADKAKLATRATSADNAKRLGGKSPADLLAAAAAAPGPASSVAALVGVRTTSAEVPSQSGRSITAPCAPGEKALGGGVRSNGSLTLSEAGPSADGTAWVVNLANPYVGETRYAAIDVVCIK